MWWSVGTDCLFSCPLIKVNLQVESEPDIWHYYPTFIWLPHIDRAHCGYADAVSSFMLLYHRHTIYPPASLTVLAHAINACTRQTLYKDEKERRSAFSIQELHLGGAFCTAATVRCCRWAYGPPVCRVYNHLQRTPRPKPSQHYKKRYSTYRQLSYELGLKILTTVLHPTFTTPHNEHR